MKKGALIFLLLSPTLLVAQTNKDVTADFLQSFADAFNAHDITSIMLELMMVLISRTMGMMWTKANCMSTSKF